MDVVAPPATDAGPEAVVTPEAPPATGQEGTLVTISGASLFGPRFVDDETAFRNYQLG